ncbi:MAG: DUF2179 domain-containing protein [Bacteroidales bacterium]|nr:DUF2179 domain-containing protein [Bacteroidales bacterium]
MIQVLMEFIHSDFFTYVLIPLFIFCARIIDVSLGTLRIIFVTKGMRRIAPLIGFFEVFIWLLAISRIMQNLENWVCYVAYAAGFASGNLIGMLLEEKLAIGHEMIRVITRKDATTLINVLRETGHGVTWISAQGVEGEVAILYIIARRSMIEDVLALINKHNPRALYTVEAIKYVNKEIFHRSEEERHHRWLSNRGKRTGK